MNACAHGTALIDSPPVGHFTLIDDTWPGRDLNGAPLLEPERLVDDLELVAAHGQHDAIDAVAAEEPPVLEKLHVRGCADDGDPSGGADTCGSAGRRAERTTRLSCLLR